MDKPKVFIVALVEDETLLIALARSNRADAEKLFEDMSQETWEAQFMPPIKQLDAAFPQVRAMDSTSIYLFEREVL